VTRTPEAEAHAKAPIDRAKALAGTDPSAFMAAR